MQLNINATILSKLRISVDVNTEHWNEATEESRKIFMLNCLKNYLEENYDEIIDEDTIEFSY